MRGKTAKLLMKQAIKESNGNAVLARIFYKKLKKNWPSLKHEMIRIKQSPSKG
jgi:hypothetical protein